MSKFLKRSAQGAGVPHEKRTSNLETVVMPLPSKIVLSMGQHIGAPAAPAVAKGDQVYVGTVVGKAGGFVSSDIHSGVSGTVDSIVTITAPNGAAQTAVVIIPDGEQKVEMCIRDRSHPVKQGLVQMLSVFIDTILVCTATAMMCLCTGIDIKGGLEGAPLVQASLATTFGAVGPYFITFALLLFAFTTLLGNLFYCEGCLNYIANRKLGSVPMTVFRLIACGLVFVGAQLSFGLVWDLADVLMGIMAIINLPVIVILGRTAMRALQDLSLIHI